MNKRFKVEFVDIPAEPFWFDTQEEVDRFIEFNKGCPVDDVPGGVVKLKVTEFRALKTEVV